MRNWDTWRAQRAIELAVADMIQTVGTIVVIALLVVVVTMLVVHWATRRP